MSLVVRNLQKSVPLRRAVLRKNVEILRQILDIGKFDVGLVCVDNCRIQKINKTYRGVNVPTDVLSFPFYEHVKAGELPTSLSREDSNLGDVFLGVEYILTQSRETAEDFYGILTIITAHGLCHLLGYRHDTEEEWCQMSQKESYVLEEYNRITGSRLQPLTKR